MDKKNTILLTVIAVATLLVAVVGATFAYYLVQVQGSASKVNVNVKSSAVGVLTLSTPQKNLYMNVLPEDMANFGSDKTYYATAQTNNDGVSNKSASKGDFVISQLIVEGGETTTSYTCTAKLKVTLDTAEGTMGHALQVGDLKLYLSGSNVVIKEASSPIDLHDILQNGTTVDESKKYKEYDITYNVDGNSNKTAQIKADIELINKKKGEDESGDQSYLAGKSLSVDLEIVTGDTLDCSIDAATTD